MNKKSVREGKKRITTSVPRHRILPSCGCKAREIVVAKCELVLWGTSPVDKISLIGPFKPCLAENISLQSSNCNILGLAATVALTSLTKPNLLRFRCSLSISIDWNQKSISIFDCYRLISIIVLSIDYTWMTGVNIGLDVKWLQATDSLRNCPL